MPLFDVIYEIVTPESAEWCDVDEQGFIAEGCSLRDAVKLTFETRTNRCDGVTAIECDEYPVRQPRWITVTNGAEYETGAVESRSLHIPANVTATSRRRIARLMGVRVP